jgi:hypothetical protein
MAGEDRDARKSTCNRLLATLKAVLNLVARARGISPIE